MEPKNSKLLVKNGPKGYIESLPPDKRMELDKELVAGARSRRILALEYGCSQSTLEKYWTKVLSPRIRIARSKIDDARRRDARAQLAWLFEKLEEGLGHANTTKDAKAYGPLINAGNSLVRTQAELDGKLGQSQPQSVTVEVVRVLHTPKLWEVEGRPAPQVIEGRVVEPKQLEPGEGEGAGA